MDLSHGIAVVNVESTGSSSDPSANSSGESTGASSGASPANSSGTPSGNPATKASGDSVEEPSASSSSASSEPPSIVSSILVDDDGATVAGIDKTRSDQLFAQAASGVVLRPYGFSWQGDRLVYTDLTGSIFGVYKAAGKKK